MGCDIHGFAEWKWKSSDPDKWQSWELIAPVPDMRSYRVFELLANVRTTGDIDKQFTDSIPLRGVPKSWDEYRGDPHGYDLGDHSFTWYTLEELRRPDMWDQIDQQTPRELWKAYLEYLKWYKLSWWECDVRIVIGFDN